MASDYGINFGFRRSDESVRVSEGRFRTPTTGAALLIGTAVQVDPANPGYLKACASAAALVPGYAGVLVQEEVHLRSFYDLDVIDSNSLGVARKGLLSVITTGAGTKVWFKNSTTRTLLDGRVLPTVNIFNATNVNVGSNLGWNGTQWAVAAGAADAWFTVTVVNNAAGYCEAVLLK
jgi:hypothetical protein